MVFKTALKRDLFTFVYEFIRLGVDIPLIFYSSDRFFNGSSRYDQFIKDLYNNDVVVKLNECAVDRFSFAPS